MPALDWQPDPLDGYRQHVFDLGRDPDGQGSIAAVLVRREPRPEENGQVPATGPGAARGAVLYVHGFADYFFQTGLADFFAARGLAFYALDLRKSGRARRAGQTAHYVSDLAFYDDELERSLAAIREEHPDAPVLLAAHSTGGLILPLWLARRQAKLGAAPVSGLILNSPWFDLQGPPSRRGALTQALRVAARTSPYKEMKLPRSLYGDTLHTSGTGEWEFDLELKPLGGFPVTFGWLNAVRRGHSVLHRGLDLGVPSLVLRSDRTDYSGRYSELSERADLVLDVRQIARWVGCLGDETAIVPIPGAKHDVFLSVPEARAHAYEVVGAWLDQHPRVTGAKD